LTHLDSEHNDEHWKTYKKVEANLTKIHDDPSHAIPLGPPAVTTLEPTSGPEDEDEMTFTGAWFTPALPIDPLNIEDDFSPAAYCCPTESEPPALIPRHEIYDSDDEDSDDDAIATDDGSTEPEVKSTKRVHKKKNSRANVQEVKQREKEQSELSAIICVISQAQSSPVTSTNLPCWHLRRASAWDSVSLCCILDGRRVCALRGT
jgi:hypothetical protein